MNAAIQTSGLSRRILADGLLSEEALEQAVASAAKQKQGLVSYLVAENLVKSDALATMASTEFGTPYIDISVLALDRIPQDIVDEKLIRQHRVLPICAKGRRLFIAVSDPSNLRAVDDITFQTGKTTEAIVANEKDLQAAIAAFLESSAEAVGTGLDDLEEGLEDLDISAVDEDGEIEADDDQTVDETPIVRFVNKVLLDAIRGGASDIHFEPYEKSYRVRFRTDGILKEMTRPPNNLAQRLSARLKVMSQMDISERRVPQDGRIKMKLSKTRAIDFRVNTLPTLWGEKIVLRILDPTSAQMGIDALGYEDAQKQLYMEALHQPQGMILVTGPTGSGKTVSLYTGLNILNTPERNISTAEDPVEINLEGINQVHVNAKVGLDFSSALRSFLRQDPDIIMVGEIRDLETAEIAIKASQTGHLVLSTLHTNSAAETITRLLNMGVPAFNVATSVSLIIAQRLARRLCSNCSEPMEVPKPTLLEEGYTEEQIPDLNIRQPNKDGCQSCSKGYKGRVGIYEVVKVSQNLAKMIMEGGNSIALAEQAGKEGFNNLRKSALLKAAAGVTSLEEVNRVTKD